MTNAQKFVDVMLASEVVTAEQIESAQASLRALGAAEVTDDALANELIHQGHLTAYQAEQLQSGRTRLHLGPYIVTDWIGQGGMGQVYKAVHQVMGRECAVKVLPKDKSTPSAIANFQHEIRAQAKLDHPNLVHAYDAGHDGKVHYLVTEYVPGEDLRKLVKRQGPLTMRQAANVIRQAALALEHAHENRLIHRDIKPGNILVTPDGITKLSDLGLAGFAGADDPQKGKIVGTPDYLSPEQIRSPDDIDLVSDIYSLGCTLYYAVTGKVPYPGGSPRDKVKRHLDPSITPMHPRAFNADVTEEFIEVIADMMEKDPTERIPTAQEVINRLEPWTSSGSHSFPNLQLPKSPWTPPPIPSEDDEEPDTNVGNFEELDSERQEESTSQGSQGTEPSFPSAQDTHGSTPVPVRLRPSPFGEPPPLPKSARMSRGVSVAIALAVAIPMSMLIGALITFALVVLLR